MRIPLRSYIIFAAMVIVAAYGFSQVWSLTVALQEGDVGLGDTAAGAVGAVLLAVSATVLVRILYLLQHAPPFVHNAEQAKDGSEDE